MKRSVSSSSSHFVAWISSGPVATVLRGPMEAVAMSLLGQFVSFKSIMDSTNPLAMAKR